MNAVISDLVLRSLSTLAATLTTVIIITERQRRINNAKLELAARYIESIDHEHAPEGRCKDVIKDLTNAEELIREITWGQIARASKIDEVVRVTRKLAHQRRKHEKLEKNSDVPEREAHVLREIEEKKFEDLAMHVRALRISFIDFVFITSGKKPARSTDRA
jgi:hypothetical protein